MSRINTALITEMSSLRALLRISEMIPGNNGYVNEAVSAYVSVIGREELKDWPSDGEDKKVALFELIRRLFEFAAQPENFHDNAVLNKTFLDELNKVRAARFEQIQIAESNAPHLKVSFLIFFGLLTQIAIALCHAGQRRASWATVMLFSFAFATTMSLITLIDIPFFISTCQPQAFGRGSLMQSTCLPTVVNIAKL